MILSLRDLDYSYSGPQQTVQVLDGINLSIRESEFLGIIGQSGAGKSTLLLQLNGLLRPSSGKVFYKGQDIWSKGFNLKALRSSIGMLFQYPENNFFGQTVFEDLAYGPLNHGLTGKRLDQAIENALNQVEIPLSYLKRTPFSLSGGEKRRVALAGILAMKPEVLVLDEPTVGLDPFHKQQFLDLMQQLNKQGITIIMVTHELEQVCEYTERVIVLKKGRVLVQGPTRSVMTGLDLEEPGLELPDLLKLGKILQLKYQGQPILTEDEALESILIRRGGCSA